MAIPWREAVLLARYHVRILNWWIFGLMLLGFGGFAILSRNPDLQGEICRFVMEPYVGLLAALLGSSLIMGDPILEVILVTRTGGAGVVIGRFLLSFFLLALCSAGFLAWSLSSGMNYARQQNLGLLLLLWLAPMSLMVMLGVFGALSTRSPALGLTLALLPLATSLFLATPLSSWRVARWFFVTYTYSAGADAPDWWINRLVLLGCALLLVIGTSWLLQHDEHLVNRSH